MDTQSTPPPLHRTQGALPAELQAPPDEAPPKRPPLRRNVPILDSDADDADDAYFQAGAFFAR